MGYSAKIVAVAAIAVGLFLWYKQNKRQGSSRRSVQAGTRSSATGNANRQLSVPKAVPATQTNRAGSPSKPSAVSSTNPPATERAANLLRTESSSSPSNGHAAGGQANDGPVVNDRASSKSAAAKESKQVSGKAAEPTSLSGSNQSSGIAAPIAVDAFPTAVNSQITDAVADSGQAEPDATVVNPQITDATEPSSDTAGGHDDSASADEPGSANGSASVPDKNPSKRKGKKGQK